MIAKTPTNRIAFLRLARKWTQQELADRVDAHWVTISKLERGQMRLTQDWMHRLAQALSVDPGQLIVSRESADLITGIVSGRGTVDEREQVDSERILEWSLEIGKYFYQSASAWYYAEDALYPPVIRAHDLLRFTNIPGQTEAHLLGRICLLPFTKKKASLVGVLHRGSKVDFWDLEMPDGSVRRDVAHALDLIMALTLVIARAENPIEEQARDSFE